MKMADLVEEEIKETKKTKWTFMEAVLFKLDRNIAISGIIAIGVYALYKSSPEFPDLSKIAMAAITGLGVIVGVRVGSK